MSVLFRPQDIVCQETERMTFCINSEEKLIHACLDNFFRETFKRGVSKRDLKKGARQQLILKRWMEGNFLTVSAL